MAKVADIQSAFNAGEFSPLLYGRVDFDKYKLALSTCLNGIPLVQGGWTRRPGTKFAAEVKDSSKATRLVRFEFSTTQAYVIEFGNLYIRFYRNNGPVLLTAQNITGATAANPVVVTYAGSDTYANGDDVIISGVVGMTQLNGRRFRVANVNAGANTFELTDLAGNNIDGSAYTAWSSGGTIEEVYTVTTPWAEADLFQLKFTQSADVLYVSHPSYAPRKISRTAHTAWTVSTIDFLDGPYLAVNSTATTMTLAATSGATTITASSTTGINGGQGFLATDVGRSVRVKTSGAAYGWGKITGVTSTTLANITLTKPVGATTATAVWRLGLWSDTTGYPGCTTFYEDRLGWGGATAAPQRVDFSKTSDYENMAPTAYDASDTVADDNALSFTLNSGDVQVIRWMDDSDQGLLVGTVKAEWAVRPSSLNEALTPTNVKATRMTGYGGANISPLRTGQTSLFLQRSGRKVRELAFVYSENKYKAPDMTVLAEHVTLGGVKEMAYQQETQSLVWAARNDGVLLGFTYERDQNVIAWHRHVLGGVSSSGGAAPLVESVASIPSADGTRDETWMVVKRYIGGRTVRYVEYLSKMYERGDAQDDSFFVDCGATYDGSAVTTISGLWHLAGETVTILADGATHPSKTVSALGALTLDRSAAVVQVGYGYNSDGALLRNNSGAADGTAQGKIMRKHKVTFRLHDSLGIQVGPTFSTTGPGKLTRPTIRTSADDANAAVPLFSGDLAVDWEGDYSKNDLVCWRFDQPLPGTVLAIMPQQVTQDA